MFKKIIFSFLLLLLLLLIFLLMQIPDNKFHIFFLDIGQGDSIFIKTPENHQILIDSGPGPKIIEELNKIIPYFDRSLDLLVLSHPHQDHYMGFLELLSNYDVDLVLLTAVNYDDLFYSKLIKTLENKKVEVIIAHEKMDLFFNDVLLDIIYPFESLAFQSFDNINNSSIVIKVTYKENVILLTGDIESEIEEELLDYDMSANILKVPHHGSNSSSSLNFLRKINPEIAIIQSGRNNKFGHPHEETLERFANLNIDVLRNDLEGTIEFIF